MMEGVGNWFQSLSTGDEPLPPFFKIIESLKHELAIQSDVAHEVVVEAAATLGISSSSADGQPKPIGALSKECYLCLHGSSMAGRGSFPDLNDLSLGEDSVVSDIFEKLTAGEQQAECCICFDYLHERPVAAFTCGGKRTCPHFFHDDCAAELLKADAVRRDKVHTCPVCRRKVDARIKAPKASDDPDGWFKCVDVQSDGKLTRAHVIAVLISQFPIDHAKLEAEMPKLWEKWDVDRSGFLSKKEVIGGEGSLLHFVTTHLLKEEPKAGSMAPQHVKVLVPDNARPGQQIQFEVHGAKVRATLPPNARPGQHVIVAVPAIPGAPQNREQTRRALSQEPQRWFSHFDANHSGRLTHDQLLRALAKTNPRLTAQRATELIRSLGLVPAEDIRIASRESITLQHFMSIHEILRQAVDGVN